MSPSSCDFDETFMNSIYKTARELKLQCLCTNYKGNTKEIRKENTKNKDESCHRHHYYGFI